MLRTEILKHKNKIQKISGFSDKKFNEIFKLITSKIRFVDDILISDKSLKNAFLITQEIDEYDTLFVALSYHLKSKLWSGDKILEKGLKKQDYPFIISTSELYGIFIKKELKRKRSI